MSNIYTKYIAYLLVISISLLLVNIFISFAVIKKYNDDNILLETKRSKLFHLDRLDVNPDYIFVGNSRTQNHINTEYLSSIGLHSYNLGLPGSHWEDQDILIQKAAKYANKAVIVSIPVKSLFTEVDCPFLPLIERVFMDTYKACNVLSAITPNFNNLLESVNNFNRETLDSLDTKKKAILEIFDVELDDLGNEINYIRDKEQKRYVVFYTNGDSLVISHRAFNEPDKEVREFNYLDKKFNDDAIRYMQYLEDKIIESGKKAIFVIEPTSFRHAYLLDTSLLNKHLKSYIIDNTGFLPDYRYWSDISHLNYLGRRQYTLLIKDQLLKNPN